MSNIPETSIRIKHSEIARRRGRPPGFFIRIERNQTEQRERIKFYVAKGLWYALSQPNRVELHRVDDQIILSPTDEKRGYKLEYSTSMPRFWCDNSEHMLEAYPTGHYMAEVRDGRIFMHKIPQEQMGTQQSFD